MSVLTRCLAWARSPESRWVWVPLLVMGATRLTIALVALASLALLPDSESTIYHLRGQASPLLDIFGSRWDTGFYVSIAEEGYRYQGVPLPSVAFFPLLPMLMRLGVVVTGDAVVAGILISNLSLLVAAMLLYRLVEAEFGQSTAGRSVWYLLIFPMAFFGSAIYTESLFLLCSIGAFYSARRRRWGWAGIFGLAAALTRLIGVILAPVLLVEWWMQRRRTEPSRPPLLGLAAAALVPLGTVAFMLYLQRTFDDPLAFVHATAAWDRVPRPPLVLLAELLRAPVEGWGQALATGAFPLNDWIDLLSVAVFLLMGTALLAQSRWSEGLFVVLGALIPLYSGLLMSQRRYMWVLFPAFILLARWTERRPWLDRVITLLFAAGLALSVALFANGYWVA